MINSLKKLLTNVLFLRNINDSLNTINNIKKLEIEDKNSNNGGKKIKANEDTILILNFGKHELNNEFLTNLAQSLKKTGNNKKIMEIFKKHLQLEILEHPFDSLDNKLLNKEEIKQKQWQNILDICNKYGLKIHIDDFNGKDMYNRVENVKNIFQDNLKSIKIDKK